MISKVLSALRIHASLKNKKENRSAEQSPGHTDNCSPLCMHIAASAALTFAVLCSLFYLFLSLQRITHKLRKGNEKEERLRWPKTEDWDEGPGSGCQVGHSAYNTTRLELAPMVPRGYGCRGILSQGPKFTEGYMTTAKISTVILYKADGGRNVETFSVSIDTEREAKFVMRGKGSR